jgi:sugar lactone lactonase YvrE
MNRKRINAIALPQSEWRGVLLAVVILVVLLALMAVLAIPASARGKQTFPPVFNVPDGWQPEGIAVGRGSSFFVGSLLTGAIYGGDLRTGEGGTVVQPQQGRIAVGLAVDERSNAIFVAGGGPALGPTIPGSAYVYDADTGAELAVYSFGGFFINDVVVNREAAYFTDSFQPVLFRVPLGPGGELPEPSAVQAIPLGDGFDFVPGDFNANGIEATPDGKSLIVVNTATASLYNVDPLTGDASKIDLGGDTVENGDGLVLAGKTLYVVQNFVNKIGIVDLDPTFTSGTVSSEVLTNDYFMIPTTAAKFGSTIYAVNARFGEFTPGVPSPELEFTVVGLPMR